MWQRSVQLPLCEHGSGAGLCPRPITFQQFHGLGITRVVYQSHCGASVSNIKVTDIVFADDAVILMESLEILMMALKTLHEETNSLVLQISWGKTKVQVHGNSSLFMHVARTLVS